MTVLFLDANVPMYAAGRPHPLKEPCSRVLELAAINPESFVTDAEVLQEILHRYVASSRATDGQRLVHEFAELMLGRVEPIFAGDVEAAAREAVRHQGLQARDLIHLAVLARITVSKFVSADSGFDSLGDLERLDPLEVAQWAHELGLDLAG